MARGDSGESMIQRAFRVLGAFSGPGEALTLGDVTSRARLPKATALRICRELAEQRALERRADGRYVLGLGLHELATLAPRSQGLRAVALPYMQDLHMATGQHVLLAVREGDESVLVERLSSHDAGKVMYRVGGRLPLHSTGVGRVLLAHAPTELQEQILSGPLVIQPERVAIPAKELRAQLAAVRQEGIATMSKQLPEPMTSMATALRGEKGMTIAALSVIIPTSRGSQPGVRSALIAVARAISRELGGVSATSAPGRAEAGSRVHRTP